MHSPHTFIRTEQLSPHPEHPRIGIHEEHVAYLEEQFRSQGGIAPEYALLVRSYETGYQVINGHHRLMAAQRAGLHEVPCQVGDLSNYEAYMGLALSNEENLSLLEIGVHALGAIEEGKAGPEEVSASSYAQAVKQPRTDVSRFISAARVYKHVPPALHVAGLKTRARHLYEVSRAPRTYWSYLVREMLEKTWSIRQVRATVRDLRKLDKLLPVTPASHVPGRSGEEDYISDERLLGIRFAALGWHLKRWIGDYLQVSNLEEGATVYLPGVQEATLMLRSLEQQNRKNLHHRDTAWLRSFIETVLLLSRYSTVHIEQEEERVTIEAGNYRLHIEIEGF